MVVLGGGAVSYERGTPAGLGVQELGVHLAERVAEAVHLVVQTLDLQHLPFAVSGPGFRVQGSGVKG